MKSLMKIDPFRAIGRWDPFEDLRRMQKEMDRLFERFLGGESAAYGGTSSMIPSVESYTKEGQLVYRFELPGLDEKDIDVSVTDAELVVKGDRKASKETKDEDYLLREISYGTFERHVLLPQGALIDDLKARFSNGVLEVTVPVPEAKKARKVEIERATEPKKDIPSRKAA